MIEELPEQNSGARRPPPANIRKHLVSRLPPLRFPVAALLLGFFLFTGAPDEFARQQLNETRNQTAMLLATAVGVDAGISLLQSMELSVELGAGISGHPGELLDPVNDALERLSWILIWALGSLTLQQLVLDGVSSGIFNWIFLGVTLGTVAMYLAPYLVQGNVLASSPGIASMRHAMIRAFCVVVVLRLIIPSFMAASLLVSQWLDPAVGDGQAALDRLQKSVPVLQEQASIESDTSVSDDQGTAALAGINIEALLQRKSDLEKQVAEKHLDLEAVDREINRINTELDALRGDSVWDRLRVRVPEWLGGVTPSEPVTARETELDRLVARREQAQEDVLNIESEIDCIDRQQSGESCESFWQWWLDLPEEITESVRSLLPSADLSERVQDFRDQVMDSMYDLTKSVIAVVIKNIVLPIGYIWIVAKLALPLAGWLTNWSAHSKSPEGSGQNPKGLIEPVRSGEN